MMAHIHKGIIYFPERIFTFHDKIWPTSCISIRAQKTLTTETVSSEPNFLFHRNLILQILCCPVKWGQLITQQ
jgi:hypothetical protein